MSSNKRANIPKRDEKGNLHYYKDLTGQRFGRLIAEQYLYTNNRRKAVWKCKCDCGNYTKVESYSLKSGNTRSCGCLFIETSKEKAKKLIKRQTKYKTDKERKIMVIFNQMKRRCYNPKCKAYKNYGLRGIKIYKEWLENPTKFYEWSVNNGWKNGLSIDRINVNGNYEPENCRWVDNITQQNNKQNSKYLVFKNKKHTQAEWARILNIPVGTIADRTKKGWEIEKILNNKYTRKV